MSKKTAPKKTSKTSAKHTRKRTRFFTSNRLVFGTVILVVILAMAGCGIGYYFNNVKMEEISVDDNLVTTLATRYFRGPNACVEYDLGLFSDGTVYAKDLSYDTKEQLAIEYAVVKGYNKISFSELKEVYNLLFDDGSTLQEKYYYESTSGTYEKYGNTYELEAYPTCVASMPMKTICMDNKEAYKSSSRVKIIAGLFSGTAETGNLYSGLNWDDDHLLGAYGEFDLENQDFAKWEIVYRYNSKLGTYFLDYTKKL